MKHLLHLPRAIHSLKDTFLIVKINQWPGGIGVFLGECAWQNDADRFVFCLSREHAGGSFGVCAVLWMLGCDVP